MASPDSLTAWRDFLSQQITEPTRFSTTQVRALSQQAKDEYDDARFTYLASDVVLQTKDIESLDATLRVLLARNKAKTSTARRGLAVSGAAGIGKSTAALLMGRRHERKERSRLKRGHDPDFAPVVYAVIPSATTPKMLMQSFVTWLGLQASNRDTAQNLTDMVVEVLQSLGTSLVILDEVHNLRTNRQAGAEAASSLKMFSDRVDATFVYCGIDLPDSQLFSGQMGRQIRARMVMHQMNPYGHGSAAAREMWTELVLGVEDLLPLTKHKTESLEPLAGYLWDRTGGSIGALRALLSDAAIMAIQEGHERVDRKILDRVSADFESELGYQQKTTLRPNKEHSRGLQKAV